MKRALLVFSGLIGLVVAGLVFGTVLLSHVGSQTAAAVPVATVSYGNLQSIGVFAPDDDPTGLAFLVSDTGGLKTADRELAEDLVDAGMIVLPIDLDRWQIALQAASEAGDDCLYLGSDIEGIAKEALRTLNFATYFHPVVVGRGMGGTLAFAAVADAPAATVAGGVALDAAPGVRSTLPVCEGAKASPGPAGSFAYDRATDIPAPFTFVADQGPGVETSTQPPLRAGLVVEQDPGDRVDAMVTAAASIADADSSELPIIVSKPQGKPIATVVFFSGDGGWRDLDKTIGDWLAEHDVEVIGVDSLRYFWAEKTPEQMAQDIATMLDDAKPAPDVPVALFGYSFGADTLPFAYTRLAQSWKDRVGLVALLAPSTETGFQVSVGGWLGLSTGDRGVVAAVAAIPTAKVLCVYGTQEDETACTDPKLAAVAKLPIDGGHHFDGNYDAMAEKLLAAIRAAPPAARVGSMP